MLRDSSDARGAYDLDDGTGIIYGSWVNKAGLDHAMFSAMIHQLCVVVSSYNTIRFSNLIIIHQATTVWLVSWAILSSVASVKWSILSPWLGQAITRLCITLSTA